MSKKSFIYSNLAIYRFIMNILYLGGYRRRFQPVIRHIQALPHGSSVLELCFGDVRLAEFCKKAGYRWKGLDINSNFVNKAQEMGFDAEQVDLAVAKGLPKADMCIMMGSLYHFSLATGDILNKMFKVSTQVVFSEPIFNLSCHPGPVGFLARRAASVGKGQESFRYNKASFMAMLSTHSDRYGFEVAEVNHQGKDLIVKLIKK